MDPSLILSMEVCRDSYPSALWLWTVVWPFRDGMSLIDTREGRVVCIEQNSIAVCPEWGAVHSYTGPETHLRLTHFLPCPPLALGRSKLLQLFSQSNLLPSTPSTCYSAQWVRKAEVWLLLLVSLLHPTHLWQYTVHRPHFPTSARVAIWAELRTRQGDEGVYSLLGLYAAK